MSLPWLRTTLTGVLLALCCRDTLAVKLPAPPTVADLAGTWVGPDEAGAVLRLKIDRHGAGSLEVREREPHGRVERFTVVVFSQAQSHALTFAVLLDPKAVRALALSGASLPGGNAVSLVERFEGDDGMGLKALLVREDDLVNGLHALGELSGSPFRCRGQ